MNDEQPQIITLPGLEGNDPTHLSGFQVALYPYTNALILFWAVVFCVTLAVVVYRGIIQPFRQRT